MALTILTGSSQAAGVNYSYRTSGSADWTSVPTASYFYDQVDKLVRYKTVNSEYVTSLTSSVATTASFALQAQNATSATSATTANDATSISSAIINNTDNQVLTATGTGTINGEANLTFNGSTLTLSGSLNQSVGGLANGTFSQAHGSNVISAGAYSHAEGSGSATFTNILYSANSISSGVIVMNTDLTTVFQPGNRLYYNSDVYPDNTTFIVSSSVWNGSTTTITLTNTSITDAKFVFGSLDYPYLSWGGSGQSQATAGHAEGFYTNAIADFSHAEGQQTQTFGQYSHAEGRVSQAIGIGSHAEGNGTKAIGNYSHTEGRTTQAIGDASHAEGDSTIASGSYSHAEGGNTQAIGNYSHAEGAYTIAQGEYSHAEGDSTQAIGQYSHAEGNTTITLGSYSHAEGQGNAFGNYSHAEGESTNAGYIGYRINAHITAGVIDLEPIYGDQTSYFSAGGYVVLFDSSGDIDTVNNTQNTYLYEIASSAFTSSLTQITLVDTTVTTSTNFGRVKIGIYGTLTPPAADEYLGQASHAEGGACKTIGEYSHAAGNTTEALGWYQSVVGMGNKPISDRGAFIVGDGDPDNSIQHNLLVAAAGNVTISGSLTVSGSITMSNRPAFRVTGNGGGTTATSYISGSKSTIDYNQGGHYDNTTGIFTAPISGLYQVNVVIRANSNSLGTISQLIVYKNNTTLSPGPDGTVQVMVEYHSNTSMNHAGGSTISYLEAGDTLRMVVAVGELSFDGNDNFSVAYIG